MCYDWAAWDDTYDFVVSESAGYEESNLIEDAFGSFDLLYIYDVGGSAVWETKRSKVV